MRVRILALLFTLLTFVQLPVHADTPLTAPQNLVQTTITFKQLGEKTLSLKAVYDQTKISFTLPAGRQVRRAVLNLRISHGQKLLPEASDLTIVLNNEPAASVILSPENAVSTTIPIELPLSGFQPGKNTLTFRLNQRLRSKGCGDVGDARLWTKIHSDSTLKLETVDTPIPADLGQYPRPFTSLTALADTPQVLFVLPDAPSSTELTAAAAIAAALGQTAAWKQPPLQAVTVSQLAEADTANNHLLAIGSADRNPLAKNAAPGITETASPYNSNRLLLVVSGATDAALRQAGNMLATASAWEAFSGTTAAPMEVSPHPTSARTTRATFAELGFTDRRVRGIGTHDIYFPIDVPYNWKPTSDASIEVRFSHASVQLDAATSKMSAFINGFKVSNVALTKRNDTNGRLVIQLSPRQIHPGRNWLHLSFDLHVKREDCKFRYLQEAWATVSAQESTLNLAHVKGKPPLEMRYLPSPLVTPADLSENVFVLAAEPSAAELTAMVRIAAKLGTYSTVDGLRPRASTANRFDPDTIRADNVIAIGKPETNALLTTYGSALPQHLVATTTVNNSDQEILEPLPASIEYHSGYIQVLPAPWSRRGTLMVLSAFEEPLLAKTVAAFPTLGQRLKIQGNVAVVTPEQVIGLTLGNLANTQLPNAVRRVLAVILIGGVATIGGISWIANRRKQNGKQE